MEVTYEQSSNFNKVGSRGSLFERADFVPIGYISWSFHVDDKHHLYSNIDHSTLPSGLPTP
jgi:hypothetical protein